MHHSERALLRKSLPERKSLIVCSPAWFVPNPGRLGLKSAVTWDSTGGESPYSAALCPPHFCCGPRNPSGHVLSPALPAAVVSGQAQFFCLPCSGHRNDFGPHSGGSQGTVATTVVLQDVADPSVPALPAYHPSPSLLPWIPLPRAPPWPLSAVPWPGASRYCSPARLLPAVPTSAYRSC